MILMILNLKHPSDKIKQLLKNPQMFVIKYYKIIVDWFINYSIYSNNNGNFFLKKLVFVFF